MRPATCCARRLNAREAGWIIFCVTLATVAEGWRCSEVDELGWWSGILICAPLEEDGPAIEGEDEEDDDEDPVVHPFKGRLRCVLDPAPPEEEDSGVGELFRLEVVSIQSETAFCPMCLVMGLP